MLAKEEKESINLYLEFIKHNTPSFHSWPGSKKYSFCYGKICHSCSIRAICSGVSEGVIPKLPKEYYQKIEKEYPEYLI